MAKDVRDVIMIGAGPSALAAAIYTAREDIDTVLYEKSIVGGLAAITDKVDNYPGFADGIEGMLLAEQLEKQAKRFGAIIDFGDVSSIQSDGKYKTVVVDNKTIQAKTILIATGSSYNKLGIPGEEEYYGRGVHFCATCDGAFYKDKSIVVVGGGNSAIQEAIFLTKFVKHIDLFVRSTIKASEVLQNDLKKYIDSGVIKVYLGTTTDEIVGIDGHVTSVKGTKDGKSIAVKTDGVFVFAGLRPNTGFLDGSGVKLDDQGFVVTDKMLQTNVPGIFASGDVRSGATMQIASAVGEGATAAQSLRKYLEELDRD
jgi:thioredoxin reductase (NADPH)